MTVATLSWISFHVCLSWLFSYPATFLDVKTSSDLYKFVHFISLAPAPSVTINTPSNQTVGQSLTLESSITTVRGITSTVDIVWSSNGVEMKRIMGATASFINDNIEVYEDTYYIPLLSTADDGRVIECEIVIMTTPSTVAADNVTLNVTGMCCKALSFCLL